MKYLLYVLAILMAATTAHADLLCAKNNTKANKKGKVSFARNLRHVAGDSCPRGYTPVFNSDAFTPQLPQLFSIHQCRHELAGEVVAPDSSGTFVQVSCNSNEYVLTHGGSSDSLNMDIISVILTTKEGENVPTGVQYWFRRNFAELTTVLLSASAVCCPRL